MGPLHQRVPAATQGTTPSHPRIQRGAEKPCPRRLIRGAAPSAAGPPGRTLLPAPCPPALDPGACPRALDPGGCCAFRENASAASAMADPEPAICPADATATNPDRRDAALGRPSQGCCTFRESRARGPRRCHRHPSRPPGCGPWQTLAGSLRISRTHARRARPHHRGRPRAGHPPPSMPPGPIPTVGPQPLADPRRVVAHFAKTRPPPPPMPPRRIPTAGMQPLADPGRVVAHFAKHARRRCRCHRDPSRSSGCSPWQTLARSLRISRQPRPPPPTGPYPSQPAPKPAARRPWTAPQPTRNSAGAGTPREAPSCPSVRRE